jgi:hypothetical protein
MKSFRPTIFALIFTLMVSSPALAGNIGGLRSAGNIGGLRSAGNIGGTRSAGYVGGTPVTATREGSRLDVETMVSGSFAGLIRMLLDAGALL